ncbi:kynurenine alpha-aminoadipate aminotransferase [Moniliophthora roreri MCA 2997]|uniref:Kynurenine alpha-aminoadipate aminotransferase n=1 Tax=Moniliophthora roreri (strain MCA 2997) TaxID=1381753 RepID=V2WZ83_MONRO|nr:kynurenine alpha-aminoadipate aminotransferase [Moniliophthora roreri MCA 2997]
MAASTVNILPATFYEQFLSQDALNKKPSPIRSLFPLEKTPGLISLLAGKPNSSTFPFTSLSFTARAPSSDPSLLGPSGGPRETDFHVQIEPNDLAMALQYTDTKGIPGLIKWIDGLQEKMHNRKATGEGWRVSVGAGSQDLIYKAIGSMVNRGDPVLAESPMYAGVIPMFTNLNCELYEVATDAEGISTESLRSILEQWPSGKPKPKVLYTVPYGCNPTGMTASLARRKEVLKLAKEHNFIIFEDDPYFYLYFGTAPRVPSYFQLELEEPEVGRVLRFDSLSKILSAGLRIGFVSGPERLLNAIDAYTATSNLQTSSLTQVLALELLEKWGYEGFLTHTKGVSAFYGLKRDIFEQAMERHLKGLCEWVRPEAGLFFWFKLNVPNEDSESTIRTKALENGVLALPGTVFLPKGGKTAYVRAAFSLLSPEDVEEAVKRLAKTVQEVKG